MTSPVSWKKTWPCRIATLQQGHLGAYFYVTFACCGDWCMSTFLGLRLFGTSLVPTALI
jgi:hypothetical protein